MASTLVFFTLIPHQVANYKKNKGFGLAKTRLMLSAIPPRGKDRKNILHYLQRIVSTSMLSAYLRAAMTIRLDLHLVAIGAFTSRVKAQEAIRDGRIVLNGQLCRTPAKAVAPGDTISVTANETPTFASHGGEKLEKAIAAFGLSFAGLRVLDIGASTGGFTECALRHGARHVTAIDVGHKQLLPALQADPHVTSIEGLNARDLELAHIGGAPIDAIVCDVSFISLAHILPKLPLLLAAEGWAMLLVKPQFEVGPSKIRRGGLANSPADHLDVLSRIASQAVALGLVPLQLTHSPRLAPQKNIEYLLLLGRQPLPTLPPIDIGTAVLAAFEAWREACR